MKKYIRLIRLKHWIKNFLIMLPAVFSGRLTEGRILLCAFTGMLCFGTASSAIYVFNDLCDAENDRRHPEKCKRPIASGEVKEKAAGVLIVGLSAVTFGMMAVQFLILDMPVIGCVLFPLLYIALNTAYSKGLKNVPLADLAILVSGFVIRTIYGGVICGIEVSSWLSLTVMSGAFFCAFGKRRNELRRNPSRKVLKYYTAEFLDKNLYVSMTMTIIFYSLWAINVAKKYFIWTVPAVFLICLRYCMDIERSESGGDPVEVLLGDKALLIMLTAYACAAGALLYF